MAIVSPDRRLRQVNRALCTLLGSDAPALLSRSLSDLTPPEDVTIYEYELDRLFGGEVEHFSVEKRFVRSDGHVVWVKPRSPLSPAGSERTKRQWP